jgi:hypothetical protein
VDSRPSQSIKHPKILPIKSVTRAMKILEEILIHMWTNRKTSISANTNKEMGSGRCIQEFNYGRE